MVSVWRPYNNLYLDARKQLKRGRRGGRQLEARELVCCAAGKSREQFYRWPFMPDPVEEESWRAAGAAAGRGAGGPPSGEWEFYGLGLDITPDVLIPGWIPRCWAERAILLAQAAGGGEGAGSVRRERLRGSGGGG